MARTRHPRKQKAEARFRYRVDIPVPTDGPGGRLNAMLDWCQVNIQPLAWEQHGHSAKDADQIAQHFARFYFAHAVDADFFRRTWCP
jgi:hypothetical protein